MTQSDPAAAARPVLRDLILADPEAVLGDSDVLRALLEAQAARQGSNVVDLRGLAMTRLQDQLSALEATHQTVLSAAYDNVATTGQVHRAILAMLPATDLDALLRLLAGDVADVLRVASVRLLIDTDADLPANAVLRRTSAAEIEAYAGRPRGGDGLSTRRLGTEMPDIHDAPQRHIRSEALIRLDLGPDYPAALLVLGATDPDQYHPQQATDLLNLFARVAERLLLSVLP